MNTSQQTCTLDLIVYQRTLNDVALAPTRVDGTLFTKRLKQIGFEDSDYESLTKFLNRIADEYAEARDSVPFERVPPPAENGNLHVYKIGEIDVDRHGEVVAERFDDSHKSHHILGKDGDGGEIQHINDS